MFNFPTPSTNNYVNIPKTLDEGAYTGSDCTAANVLAVLAGDASTAAGKVLQSTSDDDVFVYFSDHGGVGLIAMPVGGYLYAKDLIATLEDMHQRNTYNRLVFYLEACESGSMFENLLSDSINIYATTAANAHESSYAFYYDSNIGAYLGDEYSISWMEDSDKHHSSVATYTLGEQFDAVKARVEQSHCMEYGNTSFRSFAIGEFQGTVGGSARRSSFFAGDLEGLVYAPVSSRDVPVATLKHRIAAAAAANDDGLVASLSAELAAMQAKNAHVDAVFARAPVKILRSATAAANVVNAESLPVDFDCLKASVTGYEAACGRFDDYSLKYVRTLVNLCEEGVPASRTVSALASMC